MNGIGNVAATWRERGSRDDSCFWLIRIVEVSTFVRILRFRLGNTFLGLIRERLSTLPNAKTYFTKYVVPGATVTTR
jgi:hypothetical protein